MILADFGWQALAVGAVVLAGILALLQRLRVQRPVVRVATNLFWRDAVQAAPANVLHRRLRHLLAFLLVLAILWTLWFAAARPTLRPAPGSRIELFYLDASAGMTPGDRFGEARRALIADVGTVPAPRRAVYLGDAYGTRLLAPGEDIGLLARRLADAHPGVYPSPFADWTRTLGDGAAPRTAIGLHYYGTAGALRDATATRPPRAVLVQGYIAPPIRGNRGIVGLGAVPAASGAWDRADLVVRTLAAEGHAPGADQLLFRRNGAPFTPAIAAEREGRLILRDLPADGSRIDVALRTGDGFTADDRAALRLPARPVIRAALLPGVPPVLRAAIAADPAVHPVPLDQAELVVRGAGDAAPAGKPSLTVQAATAQPEAFRFTDRDGAAQPDVHDALDQLGLAQLDAGALADALHRPVSVQLAAGPVRSISVWRELFDAASGFAQSRTMPLFVAHSLRWLADPRPWIPYAAAGGVLLDLDASDGLGESPGLAERRLNGAIALTQAGDRKADRTPVTVSLTDPATSRNAALTLPADTDAGAAHATALDLPFTLALLLGVEWVLFQRGRLP